MDQQSNLLRNPAPPVTPEDYVINKAKIAEAKALIGAYEEMNEAGKESHDVFARELEQKIREGEQARMLLEQLKSQSTVQAQAPLLMPIQRPAIDYPSSTSRIEEVPGYDHGSPKGHSQQVQYQQFRAPISNQQIRHSVPQRTEHTSGSISYQQHSSQRTPANAINGGHDGGQSQQSPHQQYLQSLQQNIIPNTLSRVSSYAPFGFPPPVRPQQQPSGPDQGNYSRPVAPTQEQRSVPSLQEPVLYGTIDSKQGQRPTATFSPQVQMYSSLQTIPAQASGLSSHAVHTTGPPQFVHQSFSTQKTYPEATVSQNQATTSSTTHPPPHKVTNIANQPATIVSAFRPAALGPQQNTSGSDRDSNSVMFSRPASSVSTVVGTSPDPNFTKPQTNPSTGQTTTHITRPVQLITPTLPSMHLSAAQYIREFREVIKDWEVRVPPNSYFNHPSNAFTVFKDALGNIRIIVRNNGQSFMWSSDVDQFCDSWLQHGNVTNISGFQQPSVTAMVSSNSQSVKQTQSAMPMSMHTQGVTPSKTTVPKAIPSTVRKASTSIVQTASSSQLQSATPTFNVQRPEHVRLYASSSKQTPPSISTRMKNQGTVLLTPAPSTSQKNTSTPQFQLPTPSTSATHLLPTSQPLPSSTVQTVPVPGTPLSTMTNGVPRSVKQADKKFLASHILFGLGKRSREPDTGPTALIEPESKRHAQQAPGQVGLGIGSSASGSVGEATQAVQKPNVPLQITPTGALPSSLQQSLHHTIFTPQEMQKTSQESSGAQQQHVKVANGTSKAAADSSIEILGVSKAFPDQTSLSLQDTSVVRAALPAMQVTLSVAQQEIISGNGPVTSSGSFVPQPPATSSLIAQEPTTSSPVPLTAPVAVTSLPSGVNENTTQPVASDTFKQPPSLDALTKPQRSFIGVTSPVPSPLDPMALTSDQMPQKNLPLFLPSPESSHGIDANDDVSVPGAQSANVASPGFNEFDPRKSSGSAKKKNRVYVLAPPRPPYLVKYLQLEKRKISRASLKRIGMTSRSSVSTSVAGEEDFYNAPESHSPSYAHEQRAVELACSRLQKLSCKWDGCSVQMNSVDALIRHLNRQHKPSLTSPSNYFLCRWTQCGRRCNLREKHLEKHAFLPLNCPYEDCDESFRSAPPLWKHMRAEHEDDKLKPSAHPFHPKVKFPAAIPGIIPSYMVTTRRANPHSISNARHAVVGPWVLRNIAGLEQERLTRQKSRRTVRSSNGDNTSDEDASNEYTFLTERPTRYSSHLSQPVDMKIDDLNSEDISKMIDEGLTLWGHGEGPESDADDNFDFMETPSNRQEGHADCDSPTLGRREHRSDQEEVEKMLTELMVA